MAESSSEAATGSAPENVPGLDKLRSLLLVCGVEAPDSTALDGIEIDRETLLEPQRYIDAHEHIIGFRELLSSSYLTSLPSTAGVNQRWPLLNLLRQIMRTYGYALKPLRRAAGSRTHHQRCVDGVRRRRAASVARRRVLGSLNTADQCRRCVPLETAGTGPVRLCKLMRDA